MEYTMREQWSWGWSRTKGFHGRIMLFVSLEILCLSLSLSFVYWSKRAVDIATGEAAGALRNVIYCIVFSIVVAILAGQLASWLKERIKIRMLAKLQDSLVLSQMSVPWKAVKRWHTGDLLVRINTDCKEVVQMLADTLPSLGVTVIRLLTSWGFLYLMDPLLAGMILAITPLFLFSKIYYQRMRKLSRESKEAESHLGTTLQENLKQRLLIRSLNMAEVREATYRNAQKEVCALKDRQLRFTVLTQTILKSGFNGGYLIAFLWGVYRLHTGLISFGTLTAFLQLVARVQPPVLTVIAFVPAAIRCRTALERLMELEEGPREKEMKPLKIDFPHSLKLRTVSFRYEDRKVIDGLDMEVYPGTPVAIAGATGKGKTTLIRLILALVECEEGEIYLKTEQGQVPVSVDTRINFSYVPQGNTLFCGTIRENLLMVDARISDEQLKKALELACADFVYSLPRGIDTWVGESGQGLSEGQAQRIAIARALLHNGSVWLLDEATSALDVVTAERVVKNLLTAGRDKILIFVTHDPRLMTVCPQIVRLGN